MAYQTLCDDALKNINRKNLTMEHFSDLMASYTQANIPTYSELILGLPGETYDSFVDGICKLFEIGQHFIFEVYHCIVLPNSLLGQKEYMQKHGIKTSRSEIPRFHCTADAYYIPEKIDIITETATMPCVDWQRSSFFAAFTQAMHACGLVRCFALYTFHELGIGYRRFYEGLINYIEESGAAPYTNGLLQHVREHFVKLADGINPKFFVPHVGNLVWDHYEYLFLHISANPDPFFAEIMPYLETLITDRDILSQLAAYQKATLRRPNEATDECETDYNFHEYFRNIYINKYSAPEKGCFRTVFTDTAPVDSWENFGKFVVWYGKMGSKSYKNDVKVTEK